MQAKIKLPKTKQLQPVMFASEASPGMGWDALPGLSPKNLRIKEGQLIFIEQGLNRAHHFFVMAV